TEGEYGVDLTDFYAKIKNSLQRDEGTYVRAALAFAPRLGKILGDPPFVVDVSVSGPSHVGTLVHASSFRRNISLEGNRIIAPFAASEVVCNGIRSGKDEERLWDSSTTLASLQDGRVIKL
nr:hypothetical protein [Tanacetum cinerariifolium]